MRIHRTKNRKNSSLPSLLFTLLASALLLQFLPLPVAQEASAVGPINEYKFHNHEELTLDLYRWQEAYPEIMDLGIIGTSYLEHELWNIHLTNFEENQYRELPEIYLDGGHHGNEYCGSEITILVLQHLVQNYENDPDARFILDNSHVYITPMINPDGIDLDTRMNFRQVDLNRNYPYLWTDSASHGSGPASEIEVASNIAFMEQHEFDLYITGHTGILYLIYPWGFLTEPSPDHDLYLKVEEEVEEMWGIPCGQSSVDLYPAAGTSEDYGYAVGHAPSWTFEVDDEQFVPVSGEAISQRLQPIFEAYIYLMKQTILGHYQPAPKLVDMTIRNEDSDGFTVDYLINNTGYVSIENGSATLDIGGRENISSSLFSVDQFNETVISFDVKGDFEGTRNLSLRLDYPHLRVNGSWMEQTIISRDAGIDGGGKTLDFLDSWVVVSLFITLTVLSSVFGRRRERD